MFIECHRVLSLLSLFSAVCGRMGVVALYTGLGPRYSRKTKDKSLLISVSVLYSAVTSSPLSIYVLIKEAMTVSKSTIRFYYFLP